MFAVFPSWDIGGFNQCLLGFFPFEEEYCLDAKSHKVFKEFILSVFNKSLNNVPCLGGDNCANKKSFSDFIEKRLIACYSQRINLVVQNVSNDLHVINESVYKIIVKVRNPIPAAPVRNFTKLLPIILLWSNWCIRKAGKVWFCHRISII